MELTYRHFLDGQAATLAEAVDVMGRLQLGRTFSETENAQIVTFLRTLTGEQPRFALAILTPSVASTPKPQPFD